MGEKRLDFDAPLISVRRIASKNEPRAKTVKNPGFIPFTWEKTPGRPKGLPQDPIFVEDDDGGASVDGVETFSCKDSSFFDCSVSGFGGEYDDVEDLRSSDKDAEACEFMMGRFLTAAKAMATGPLEISSAKEKGKEGNVKYRRLPVPLPYQHRPDFVSKIAYDREELERYMDEEEEEDYAGGTHFSRACGLIPQFCLKSSFLLLNPIPGMKVRSHLPVNSPIEISSNGSLAQAADESWDVVYKHKISNMNNPVEDESKFTSESNKLTYWSDSQTLDNSSSHHSPKSPFNEDKGSLAVLRGGLEGRKTVSFDWSESVSEKYGNTSPAHGNNQGSFAMRPSIDGTLCVANTIKHNSVHETCQKDELQSKISESNEVGLSSGSEKKSKFNGMNYNDNSQLALKVEEKEKNSDALALSLLPPPLPKSPSESWLQQTLSSLSSKNPFTQSLLSIQGQHRKQASRASSKDFKLANDVGALKRRTQRTRYA